MLSVVVPSHSRVELFSKTIQSLKSQEFSDFELIVSDDSHALEDRQRIRAAVDGYRTETSRPARYLFTNPGLGQARNTNQGLKSATGRLIRILHSDDILHPKCLAWECDLFKQYSSLSLLFHEMIPFEVDEKVVWDESPLIRFIEPYQHFEERLSISTALPSGMVFKREAMESVGSMRESWDFLCDWEFFAKLLLWCGKMGGLAVNPTAGLCGWRLHPESTTFLKWKDHFVEHRDLMQEWQKNLPGGHERLFEDCDIRESFFKRGEFYRQRRLFQDCEELGIASYLTSIPWLIRNRCYWPRGYRLKKKVLSHLLRRTLCKRPRHFQVSPPACRPNSNAEEWIPDLTLSPFYEDDGPTANKTLYVRAFDNRLNTWPIRERIREAKRIRINHICLNRFYGRSLLECLKYVQPGSEVEFFFHDNQHMTWFGLKSLVNQYVPGRFEFVTQNLSPSQGTELRNSKWTIRYRCISPSAPWYVAPFSGVSIGVLTMGERITELTALIETTEQFCPFPFEIILITPKSLALSGVKVPVKQIIFEDPYEYGWITRKKNLVCREAQYSDIVVCHDRYEFSPTFFEAFRYWGHGYGLASPKTILKDGRRGLDWGVVRGLNHSWCEGGLLNYRDYSRFSYVPGGVTMIRKAFWEKFRWAEDLFWNEHEDVELSRRVQRAGEVVYLYPGTIIAYHDRWVDQNPLLPYRDDRDL